jgi:hypothetical protein
MRHNVHTKPAALQELVKQIEESCIAIPTRPLVAAVNGVMKLVVVILSTCNRFTDTLSANMKIVKGLVY